MLPPYLFAWLVTIAIEVPLVALFYRGQRTRMAIACLVATSATNLAMNLVLPRLVSTERAFLFTGEANALVAEALIYYLVAQRRDLARALTASALANGLSFGAGLILPWTI